MTYSSQELDQGITLQHLSIIILGFPKCNYTYFHRSIFYFLLYSKEATVLSIRKSSELTL